MNNKVLVKKLKNPALQWVQGCVDTIDWDITGCTLPEVDLRGVSDCLAIPAIPKWMAEMIKDSDDFGKLLRRAEAVNGELKGSIIDYNLLAEAWVLGYTVEQPLGVLMIYVDYGAGYNYLATDKANDSYKIGAADTGLEVVSDSKALKVTESEAKEKYPNFKWVSLEELEKQK